MKFGSQDHSYTGVSVPVSALRSKASCGIGEFSDLIKLGMWCKEIGLQVIQILPVNDTGFESSPYSALSAFALHPIYISLKKVPGSEKFEKEINQLNISYENKPRVQYKDVLKLKLEILNNIFNINKNTIVKNKEISNWIKNNLWIKPYAVFHQLKKKHNNYHWKFWSQLTDPQDKDITKYWNQNLEESYFYAWLQYHLEKQLKEASEKLDQLGIYLKGDIPIMMNEDSVDVWMYRSFFNLNITAGAPPDMYSEQGQNWNFPIFSWKELEADGFWWWKMRVKKAAEFYHAYRIDHVLGFFRIYGIPVSEQSGIMGYFIPSNCISKWRLAKLGFNKDRIKWLSQPHISAGEITKMAGNKSDYIKNTYLKQIKNEELYNLKPEYASEKVILELNEDQNIKNLLLGWHHDRTLLENEKGKYYRLWNYKNTTAYKSLNHKEKSLLNDQFKEIEKKSDKIWKTQGKKLLSILKKTTDMLICAEDLGVVPECVPAVLKELNILSLYIVRWAREYHKPKHPYIPVNKYHRLSVCTPSVHDTSTLRGWWDYEILDKEKKEFLKLIGFKDKIPPFYNPTLANNIVKYLLGTNSLLCIFQLQDLVTLFKELYVTNPGDERINVPGTVSEKNWTYRMYSSLEFLCIDENIKEHLKALIKERK